MLAGNLNCAGKESAVGTGELVPRPVERSTLEDTAVKILEQNNYSIQDTDYKDRAVKGKILDISNIFRNIKE